MSGRLDQAIRDLARRGREPAPAAELSAREFRVRMDERLRALERDLAEVKTRVNGLLFAVAGVALTDVLTRIVA